MTQTLPLKSLKPHYLIYGTTKESNLIEIQAEDGPERKYLRLSIEQIIGKRKGFDELKASRIKSMNQINQKQLISSGLALISSS